MSFTVNNSANANGGSTSQSVTISITAGHTVACVWYFDDFGAGGSVTSVTDSGGNTYALGNSVSDGTNKTIGTATSIAIGAGVTTVTANTSGAGGGFVGLWVWDVIPTAAPTVGATAAVNFFPTTTGTDAVTTGSLTITSSDGLLLAAGTDLSSNSLAVGTGFTADATGQNSSPSEHKAITASGAATFTAGTAGDRVLAAAIALQISSGGGGNTASIAWVT